MNAKVKRKVDGEDRVAKYAAAGELPKLIEAFEQAKRASSRRDREARSTTSTCRVKQSRPSGSTKLAVWEALLARMPMTAMIRNLGKMTSLGLVKPFSEAKRLVVRKLRRRDGAQACAHPPAGGASGAEDVRPRPR